MAAPLYQRVIRLVVVAFTGVLLLGSLADAIANALDLFTTSRAIAGSAILILAAAVGQTYLHFRGLAWQQGGQRVILRRLGPAPLAGLVGALGLLWLPSLIRVVGTGPIPSAPLVTPTLASPTQPVPATPVHAVQTTREASRKRADQRPKSQVIIDSPGAIQAGGDVIIGAERRLINSLVLRVAVETQTPDRPVSEPETSMGLSSALALFTTDRTRIRFATDFRLTDQQVTPTRRRLALIYTPEEPTLILGKPVNFLATVDTIVVNYQEFFATIGFDTSKNDTVWSCEVFLNGLKTAEVRSAVSPVGTLGKGQARMDVSETFKGIPIAYASAVQR